MAAVESMSSQRITSLSDATVMLECVHCIRLIINSHVGLDVITQKRHYTKVLTQGRQTFLIFCLFVYKYPPQLHISKNIMEILLDY